MYTEISAFAVELAKRVELVDGEFVMYCKECWWAADKNTAYPPTCPDCLSDRVFVIRG